MSELARYILHPDDLEQACRRLAISREELIQRVHEASLDRRDRELSAEIKATIAKAEKSKGGALKHLLRCQDLEAQREALSAERFPPPANDGGE